MNLKRLFFFGMMALATVGLCQNPVIDIQSIDGTQRQKLQNWITNYVSGIGGVYLSKVADDGSTFNYTFGNVTVPSALDTTTRMLRGDWGVTNLTVFDTITAQKLVVQVITNQTFVGSNMVVRSYVAADVPLSVWGMAGTSTNVFEFGTNGTVLVYGDNSGGLHVAGAHYVGGVSHLSGVLDMGGQLVTNMNDAVSAKDAVALQQLWSATNATWKISQYPDAVLLDGSRAWSASHNAGGQILTNLANAVNLKDAVTLAQLNSSNALYVVTNRVITAGSGLTGGGGMDADRTIAVDWNVAKATNDLFYVGASVTNGILSAANGYTDNATNAVSGKVWGDSQYPNAVLVDGARAWLAAHNAGSYNLTNLLAGTAADHAVNVSQFNSTNSLMGSLAGNNVWTGTSNTITGALQMRPGSYLAVGPTQTNMFFTTNATGGACTIVGGSPSVLGIGSIIFEVLGTSYANLFQVPANGGMSCFSSGANILFASGGGSSGNVTLASGSNGSQKDVVLSAVGTNGCAVTYANVVFQTGPAGTTVGGRFDNSGSFTTYGTSNTFTGLFKNGSLTYPVADGLGGQVLATDGAGNLSFQSVTAPGATMVVGNFIEGTSASLGILNRTAGQAINFYSRGGANTNVIDGFINGNNGNLVWTNGFQIGAQGTVVTLMGGTNTVVDPPSIAAQTAWATNFSMTGCTTNTTYECNSSLLASGINTRVACTNNGTVTLMYINYSSGAIDPASQKVWVSSRGTF